MLVANLQVIFQPANFPFNDVPRLLGLGMVQIPQVFPLFVRSREVATLFERPRIQAGDELRRIGKLEAFPRYSALLQNASLHGGSSQSLLSFSK